MIDNDFQRNPKVRALAELIHQLRPDWNRAGIMAALQNAKTKTPPALIRAAIDAALDPTVTTPGVIATRDGAAWSGNVGEPTPVPPAYAPPRVNVGDYERNAAAARALLRAAKDAALAGVKGSPADQHADPVSPEGADNFYSSRAAQSLDATTARGDHR